MIGILCVLAFLIGAGSISIGLIGFGIGCWVLAILCALGAIEKRIKELAETVQESNQTAHWSNRYK